MSRRVLIPPSLPRSLPIGGGNLARAIWDFSGATMGTYWKARVVECTTLARPDAKKIITHALGLVVARMSPWETDSDLGRYRAAPRDSWVSISTETFVVLSRALEVAALTEGRYDPTIGRLTDALGFGPSGKEHVVALDSSVAQIARTHSGYARVTLDTTRCAVFQPGGMELDLCSIAKGYAVDLAIEKLRTAGVESCFVEIGGEARGVGCKPDGQPWWCLIEPPPIAGHALTSIVAAACDLALATSGNSLRPHIVNPRADESIEPTLESVTVLAPTCMEADVWATALFVLGAEAGATFAQTHGLAAMFVENLPAHGHRERWSPQFAAFLAE
ncbi:FAD:protein FMN transferase [Oleiharenicola lentus]|uniref:FAD:protein FMN transferase n=1 Tax=Oleiharenicola lentus TaxID=2508720 RepID=UPI003F679163